MPDSISPTRSPFALLVLFGLVAGITFSSAWWLGSPRAMGWALAGAVAALPVAWLLGRLMPSRGALLLGGGVLFIHVAAGVAGALGGLPWVELLKFALQGTLLAIGAGVQGSEGKVPTRIAIGMVAVPLILAALARQQVGLESLEGVRLGQVLSATIARGSAFPDSGSLGRHAKVWVVDRGTARIIAAPDGKGGDLADLGLEHPGRMLTEAGGAYSTRLSRHAVVAWRAVPGLNDVGVVVIVYEPTADFDEALGWSLLALLTVVGAGVFIV